MACRFGDMSEIGIRPMKESDLPFVKRGVSETNWQDIPADQKDVISRKSADRMVLADFNRLMKDKKFKFRVFVATTEIDKAVGYVSVGELRNPTVGIRLGCVLDFWVSKEFRGKGIGSRLLDYALEYIRKRGYSHASIMVSASNRTAFRMYEKRGFKPDRINLAKRIDR
jgi:ribosomal protein S18 acetylase RimI-like enzyme